VYLLPGIILLLMILFSSTQRYIDMRNDFLQFYVSAHLLGTPGFYSIQANWHLRDLVAPHAGLTGFPIRPPFQAMLLWPVIRPLPLYWAFGVFQLLSLTSLIAFTRMFAARCPSLPVCVSLSVPVAICLMNGQDAFFVLLAAGFAVLLTERGRDFAAGLVFSLCAIKFHLFLFLPLVLLIQKRWKIFGGLASGSAIFLLASFAIQGPRWPLDLLAVLRDPQISPYIDLMPNFHGLWFRLGIDSTPLEAASFALAGLLVTLAARNANFNQGFSAALVAGLLISYHAYLYDPILLLIPMVLLPSRFFWMALSLPPLYCLAVMDGPAGTAGIAGLVILMTAGLALLPYPDVFRNRKILWNQNSAVPQ
jgi:hypothetical protein